MHIPVLLKEAVDGLNIKEGDTIIDGTFGGGGHSEAICGLVGMSGRLIAFDSDQEATTRFEIKRSQFIGCRSDLITANFREIDSKLNEFGISEIDGALFDLGLSSFQLDESGRGFTFQKNEPLKMTFGQDSLVFGLTAEEIVNGWDENNLADIIYGYGGEVYSRRIAKNIIEERKIGPIKTTFDLERIIGRSVPDAYKRRKIHFATKTFQALRITVNDEIGALREVLHKTWKILRSSKRLSVISFHEIEDRVVKNFFKEKKEEGTGVLLTKKPISPGQDELTRNPRSRSAKLRIIEKI